ncbi:MAG: DUF5011 domain-containing protein, partial [Clostridia bacterium]
MDKILKSKKMFRIICLLFVLMCFASVTSIYAVEVSTTTNINILPSSGEVLGGRKITANISDINEVSYIFYYWDDQLNGGQSISTTFEIPSGRNTFDFDFNVPTEKGLHILSICVQNGKQEHSKWRNFQYYVVDNLSSSVDKTPPEFIFSNSLNEGLPYNYATLNPNQKLILKTKPDSTGIYFMEYKWTKDDPTKTKVDFSTGTECSFGKTEMILTTPNEIGKWFLVPYCIDGSNNVSDGFNMEYDIKDITAPTISLNGFSNIDVDINSTFVDLGATVIDNYDQTRTIYADKKLDTSKIGEQILTYTATDAAGNKSNVITRRVTVVGKEEVVEFTLPTIGRYNFGDKLNLSGSSIKITSIRGIVSYIMPTASMFKNFTTNRVGTNDTLVEYNGKIIGKYTYIVEDYIKDVLVNVPKTTYEFNENFDFKNAYIKKVMASGATTIAEQLTQNMFINSYNKNVLGQQVIEIAYSGKIAYLTVYVVDTTKPIISFIGNKEVTIEVGTSYKDEGATSMDECDGDITKNIITVNSVDSTKIGIYTVVYKIVDSSGNTSEITRTIKVVDTTAPIITIDNTNIYELEVKGSKPEFKAVATDNYDSLVNVVITDNIDTNVVGKYTVTFTATDVALNKTVETREFIVKDTTAPVITIDNTNIYELEVKGSKPEFKAVATDNYDSLVNVVITDNID